VRRGCDVYIEYENNLGGTSKAGYVGRPMCTAVIKNVPTFSKTKGTEV